MLRKQRQILYIALLVAIAVCIILGSYFLFFYSQRCNNYECWRDYMIKCSRANFINEEPEASWSYSIEGSQGETCTITVKLLQAKEGELGISKLAGKEMTCNYPLGIDAYAEKDLSKCHGDLKEELQGVIINKLHAYIIENIGEFDNSLSNI